MFIDAASHDLPSRRIKRDVPRDEQKVPEFYGLRIRANRAWGVYQRVCQALSRKGTGSLEVKTGVKAGSVVIAEDIVLLEDGLNVRTWIWIGRYWVKFGKIHNLTQSGLANMVVAVRGWPCYQVAYYRCTANFTFLFWEISTQFGE